MDGCGRVVIGNGDVGCEGVWWRCEDGEVGCVEWRVESGDWWDWLWL